MHKPGADVKMCGLFNPNRISPASPRLLLTPV